MAVANTQILKTDLIQICQSGNSKTNTIFSIKERKAKLIAEKKRREKRIRFLIKSLFVLITIGIFLCLAAIFIKPSQAQHYSSSYTIKGELQGNCVVLEDGNVHEVDVRQANYTSEIRNVHCLMDDNGTPEKDDDKIMNMY